jgi:soluble lytic murein transglycosylase-like protein
MDKIILRVLVLFAAARFGLDPDYCQCIVEKESSWDPEAVGAIGERGLTQILPSTGEWFVQLADQELDIVIEWDEDRLFEPAYNLTVFGIGQSLGYAHHWSTHEMCLEED